MFCRRALSLGTGPQSPDRRSRRGAGRIDSPLSRLEATVRGRVQGVSFRYTTQRQAIELGLKGWVRNAPDGSVQLIAEGSQDALDQFLQFLHQGPRFARVDQVESSWQPASGEFKRFQITH